jgi:phenylacetate-CoA ligase
MLATPELVLEAAQLARLEERLAEWRRLPFYADRLPSDDVLTRERLAGLPVITKREMKDGFHLNFLPSEEALESMLNRHELELEHTSGTSEERISVVFRTGWWDEQEQRALRLNRFVASVLDQHPAARRATLTTPACNGRSCPVVWQPARQRTFGPTRFVNLARMPFVLEERELKRMVTEILDWSPQFLDMSPVHGTRLALYCEEHGIRFPSVKFLLCSYEFVSVVHRRILERAFGLPVFGLYGSTETGHLLMEDEAGHLSPSYENAFLEVVQVDADNIGELVVTPLTNDAMPLLRYRIGDLAEKREEPYRTTYRVHGRLRDALRGGEGRRITTLQVDECFQDVDGIAHYQLRQSADELHLLFLPDGLGPGELALKTITSRLQELFRNRCAIRVDAADLILPAHSGKFRLTCPA